MELAPEYPHTIRLELFQNNTKKITYCFARRWASDYYGYFHTTLALSEYMKRNIPLVNSNTRVQKNMLIRGYRNAQYTRKERYFDTLAILGSGAFGTVSLVALRSNRRLYALKAVMVKQGALSKYFSFAVAEKDAMFDVSNRYLVKLKHAWIESGRQSIPDCMYFLCEFMMYGTLTDFIKQLFPCTTCEKQRREPSLTHFQAIESVRIQYSSADWNNRANGIDDFFVCCAEIKKINMFPHISRVYKIIIVDIMTSLLEGVCHLHQHGIVHRDIKPDNVLVSETFQFKISDMGLVSPRNILQREEMYRYVQQSEMNKDIDCKKILEFQSRPQLNKFFELHKAKQTKGRPVGTRDYMPPEISISDVDYQRLVNTSRPLIRNMKYYPADAYSLGCTFYEVCTGLHPIADFMCPYLHPSDAENFEKHDEVKCNLKAQPYQHNFGLFHIPGVTYQHTPQDLFIDLGFLVIVSELLRVDHLQRMTPAEALQSFAFRTLKTLYEGYTRDVFTWNRFTIDNRPCDGKALSDKWNYETQDLEQFEVPTTEYDMDDYAKIPDSVIFPVATGSPEIVATPPAPPQEPPQEPMQQ